MKSEKNKMNSGRKSVFGTIFTLMLFISSVFAQFVVIAPAVYAANGLGEVTFLSIDGFESAITEGVQTVDTAKTHIFKIHNNDPVGGSCIDEIIIKYPNSWQNAIDLNDVSVTNMGNVLLSLETNDNDVTNSGLVADDNAVRIVPDTNSNGVMLCPSGTTQITIAGDLSSPSSPEDSTIKVYTSDESHNEASPNPVRALISNLPVIHVTAAEEAVVKYLDFTSIVSGASPAEYTLTSQAKGGWGRLNELYVSATAGMTVDVYLENSGVGLQTGTDFKIASGKVLVAGINTISLSYTGAEDVVGQVTDGFIKDAEQGGVARQFYIDVTSGAGILTYRGHTDEDAAENIDPTYVGAGNGAQYTNPPKEGTVLDVEDVMKRKVLLQLVETDPTNSSRKLNVKDDNIKLYYSTDLSTFQESGASTATRLTDSDGQAEIRLNPGNVSGNALVEACFPDPTCTQEDIAIDAGAPVSCEITEGLDTSIQAGSLEVIEATIYDQFGNVISNDPSSPLVTFDILSSPGPDADLDDDINPPFTGDGDQFESEPSQFGIGDVSLQTSATVGNHVVKVDAGAIPCGTTIVKGVLGQAGQVDCEVIDVLDVQSVEADQCFNVLVHVKDENGNPLPVWESIVEFSLDNTDKYIQSTDFREELFKTPQKVQGKLNPNNPAFANVEVCGCDALGDLVINCKTDTLNSDEEVLNIKNSQPTCIDVGYEGGKCSDQVEIFTSILDTCGNKVVDQECSEGGFASSCIRLDAGCGVLSTDKTCVDLANTGMAPNVFLDISGCPCGDITLNAVDEADCCDSVYEGALPTCDFDKDGQLGDIVKINKLGPATHINMSVYPKAYNQDNFWASEKQVLDLKLLDDCGQIVDCDETSVNVTLSGEDCVNTTIQVDSPLNIESGSCTPIDTQGGDPFECQHRQTQEDCELDPGVCEWTPDTDCEIDNEPVHKVVIQNCAVADKEDVPGKEWTDLPEKDDIVVDKIAFEYNGPQSEDVEVCIYEETEKEAGFQDSGFNKDLLWRCIELDTQPGGGLPSVPFADANSSQEVGANDTIHNVFLLELDDRISKFNGNNEYDNQRLGGAIVEPGDTKDFYIVLTSEGDNVECGTYDADYLYFEDYNSPDIIGWSPYNFPGTHVLDTLEDSEEYTRRNDDYTGSDPYPNTQANTESYGFGDTELHSLLLDGQAFVYFRGLVAELVNIFVKANLPIFLDNSSGLPMQDGNQIGVTLLTQPATQVVARNHGDLDGDAFICDDVGFEPSIEYDPDKKENNVHSSFKDLFRKCRPAMACDGEGYDINLQVTDGFQNQVPLENTEIQLDACMTYPHFLYLGDTLLPFNINKTIDLWEKLGLHDLSSEPRDVCFNSAKFKEEVKGILDEEFGLIGADGQILTSFLGSEEFDSFVSSLLDGKNVKFLDENGFEITERDAAGHLIVSTDANGRARIRVVSDDSSMFDIKSFDTSFRIFTTPHALDADFFDVAFAPGAPSQWDVLAIPSTGIPADGEQEAKLLIRKLDACGNPIALENVDGEEVKVTATSDSGRVIISRDFSGKNNYDNQVQGFLNQWTCNSLFPWFEDCSLQVLDDVIEDAVIKVEDANCQDVAEGFCTTTPQCNPLNNPGCALCSVQDEPTCKASDIELCQWVEEPICAQDSDSTMIRFVGAPVKLKITEILHSDLIPADGYDNEFSGNDLPEDACTDRQIQECVLHGEPEVCFKNCVQYGNTGAWVTVEVQDKFGQRVTGYLGDGLKGDPGDVKGNPDNVFEKICVALDDSRAFIRDDTFGWIGLDEVSSNGARIYCGDLAYGRGSFNVVYRMLDGDDGLDPRETRKVIVSVFDVCDRETFGAYGGNWKEERWDDYCNAQEYNENNLPDSETASRLDPDANKIIFTSNPDRWDINSDKLVVAADGQDYATLTINTENEFMDIRTSVDATVQSSLLGSKIESEAITPGCYVKGTFDPINPTSINVMTEACSGGRAELKLSSTKQGVARVTVTGNSFGCVELKKEPDKNKDYIPECKEWGVIPLTPKVIEVEFKQSYQNKIELKKGWNFFSIPKSLNVTNDQWSELNLSSLCTASAYWNDPAQAWVNTVPGAHVLSPLEGYWCKASAAKTISVIPMSNGGVFLPPSKVVVPGWNDVGLSTYVEMKMEHALISIDGVYTQVLDWLEGLQRYNPVANTGEAGGGTVPGTTGTNNMEAGQGYFIYATGSGTVAGLS